MTTVDPTDYPTLAKVGLFVIDGDADMENLPFILLEVTPEGIPVKIGFKTEAERTTFIPVKYAALTKVN